MILTFLNPEGLNHTLVFQIEKKVKKYNRAHTDKNE